MLHKRFGIWALVLTLVITIPLSACSNKNKTAESSKPSDNASPQASAAVATANASNNAVGPLGKYDPPITLTTVRHFNSAQKFLPGEDWDNNAYANGYKSELGIQVKNLWLVDDQQYSKKLNVTMVSGDLPDFFEVNPQELQLLVDAGQIADLTDVFDKTASDLTKKSLEAADGIAKKVSSFNGKLMAIPEGGGGREDAQFIYIRTDWLEKLKLQPPKTMDDVMNIAKAFANNDPDGNGKKDTFGLSLDYNIFNGWSGVDGFFNGYHAYPFNPGGPNSTGLNLVFMKKGDQLDYADIQPEVKTALGKLHELYAAGAINHEFGVMSGEKSAALVTSGKVGMTFGAFWNPGWPLGDMVKADPKANWGVYPLVSSDSNPALALSNAVAPTKFWVVSKNAKHPEAVVKMRNFFMEKNYGETRDEKYHIVQSGDVAVNVFGLAAIYGGFSETNQNDYYAVQEALKAKDPAKLNPTAKGYYDAILKYRGGDRANWPFEAQFGSDDGSTYGILGQYKKKNLFMTNAFFGVPTDTMNTNGPALRDLEVKTFTKIILGESPLDSFDQFVQDWKKQGGTKIITEVNEWAKQHKS